MKTQGKNYNETARTKLKDGKWLRTEYEVLGKSIMRIANDLGCHDTTVRRALERHKIYVRSKSDIFRGRNVTWGDKISEVRIAKRIAEGSKNPNWQGGKTKLNQRIRKRLDSLRRRAKQRDSFTCQICGTKEHRCDTCKQNVQMHIDHIKPVSEFPELAFDLNNVRTVCKTCHEQITSKRA